MEVHVLVSLSDDTLEVLGVFESDRAAKAMVPKAIWRPAAEATFGERLPSGEYRPVSAWQFMASAPAGTSAWREPRPAAGCRQLPERAAPRARVDGAVGARLHGEVLATQHRD